MITLTPKALAEVKRLNTSNAALRVSVRGGGCSGLSYVLDLVTNMPNPDDNALKIEGLDVLIGSKDALFLKGLVVDFQDGLQGKGFVFENPNSKRSCGCGMSFAC